MVDLATELREAIDRGRSFGGHPLWHRIARGEVSRDGIGVFARALEKHYGLSREVVAFWDVHEIADRDHSEIGATAVLRHVDSTACRRRVRDAVDRSLGAWWQFFDGIERQLDSDAAPE